MSNWRSIHPGDWWGTGEYSMESSSWPAGTLSYMHQQGVMQVVIYTSCKQGKLQFDANTVNTCKVHRTLEARWGQHDISTCCISALSYTSKTNIIMMHYQMLQVLSQNGRHIESYQHPMQHTLVNCQHRHHRHHHHHQ